MKVIRLVDSIVIQLSKGPETISKLHPLYSRINAATTEDEVLDILAIEYDTIYEAYDINGLLAIRILNGSEPVVEYPTVPSTQKVPQLHPDKDILLGKFITYDELLSTYPEYFI